MKIVYSPTMTIQLDNLIDHAIDKDRKLSHIELTHEEMRMFAKETSAKDGFNRSGVDNMIYRGITIKRKLNP